MKTVALVLLASLSLAICAEAKTKRTRHAHPSKTVAKTPAKPSPPAAAPADADAPHGLITTNLDGRDVEFFLTAYEVGGLETWLGGQAKTRGEADKVKAVGDALQSTQAEENDLLQHLAKQKGVDLATGPTMAAMQKRAETQLAKLSGPKFDAAVMDQISEVTQQAVDAYVLASESKDPEIQRFATQVLPMVKEKLALANKLSGKALPPGAKPGFHENAPVVPQ
jgi:predicted outer membrane protein